MSLLKHPTAHSLLAMATKTHARSLQRLLRTLAGLGVGSGSGSGFGLGLGHEA
jgi:hypothetical protein